MAIKRYLSLILSAVLFLCIALLQGCSARTKSGADSEDSGKLTVYASFYTMYDFAQKIGGDKITITTLVPSGIEPHDWEPGPKDIAGMEKADLLIYNGAGMEGWIGKLLGTRENKKLIAVETSKGIDLQENDPHVWLNPLNARKQMETIRDALSQADPANNDYYEANYSRYAKQLEELDGEYKEAAGKFAKKEIVVAHEAFGYLCDAYDLTQIGIEGLNAESEPTPARMAEITEFARSNGVKVIFFEELLSPKVAETIAREVKADTAVLNPLEGLKDEDMKAGKDYFSVMRENLEALKKALM